MFFFNEPDNVHLYVKKGLNYNFNILYLQVISFLHNIKKK